MGNKKKKKRNTSSMGSLTNCKSIFQHNKKVFLCLEEKLAIITYLYSDELLIWQCILVTKCRHENKFLLKKFNSSNWRKVFYSQALTMLSKTRNIFVSKTFTWRSWKKRETLSSKFIAALFILHRIILSSILHIERC